MNELIAANDTVAHELASKIIQAQFGTDRCATLMVERLSNGRCYLVTEHDRDAEMKYHEGVLLRGKRWGERNSAQAITALTAENERLRGALKPEGCASDSGEGLVDAVDKALAARIWPGSNDNYITGWNDAVQKCRADARATITALSPPSPDREAVIREALRDLTDQLWLLAKDPENNPWVKQGKEALALLDEGVQPLPAQRGL